MMTADTAKTAVLSIDIGIKNLAICVIGVEEKEIIEWNLINLTGGGGDTTTEESVKCMYNGNGKPNCVNPI